MRFPRVAGFPTPIGVSLRWESHACFEGSVQETILSAKLNQPPISSVDYSGFNPMISRLRMCERSKEMKIKTNVKAGASDIFVQFGNVPGESNTNRLAIFRIWP